MLWTGGNEESELTMLYNDHNIMMEVNDFLVLAHSGHPGQRVNKQVLLSLLLSV